jgi:hypothetical protein
MANAETTDTRRWLGRAGAGALAFGALSAMGGKSARAQSITDADVLNFALNLEYLEAEYYLRAVTGAGLPSNLTGGSTGNVLAPANTLVPFQTTAIAYWAQRIANDELAHVTFLRRALVAESGTPVAEPQIDLEISFTTLAVAAGLITAGQTFNPFASELDFLIGAYIFEDVGVTAYAGAAALLTDPANIAYSASILAVEAEHAGLIRSYVAEIGGGGVTNAISALRQSLSGVQDNGTDLSASGGNPFSFANCDYNGQVFRRTPQEVLNIVYGASGSGVAAGLFFPAGVNGAVTMT